MTTAATPYLVGVPGLRAVRTAEYRRIFSTTAPLFLPGGKYIDGTLARDPSNSPFTDALQAGLMVGLVTSSSRYANSIFDGLASNVLTGGTTLTVGVPAAVEIVRRIGATGNLIVTGPPTAGGVTRQLTYAYSSVNQTNGQITVSALNANQVQQFVFGTAATGGNLKLTVQIPAGTFVTTANAAWNVTDATYIAAVQSALDTATGITGGIVVAAVGAGASTGFTLTYAGGAYAGQNWAMVQVALLPTSATAPVYTQTQAAVDARQIAGNYVMPTDGSQNMITFLPDGPALNVTDSNNPTGLSTVEFPQLPVAAVVISANLINYSNADASLKTWTKQQLSTFVGGKYMFDDSF